MYKLVENMVRASEQPSVSWTGGAGFVIRTDDMLIGLDLYLSDACMQSNDDFKRLIPPPFEPEEIKLDYLICTHEHGDHLDTGSLHKFINEKTNTMLVGTNTVVRECAKLGIASTRMIRLDRGESVRIGDVTVTAVLADHGDLSLDAIGVIISIGGKAIYFTGDTCFRPDLPKLVPLPEKIDVLIVPINGKYGNPDAKDAAYITAWVRPKTVIPCHYWLFKEHGGDPGLFGQYCRAIAPDAKVKILAVGERFEME